MQILYRNPLLELACLQNHTWRSKDTLSNAFESMYHKAKKKKRRLSAPVQQRLDLNERGDKRNVEQTWVVFKTTYK